MKIGAWKLKKTLRIDEWKLRINYSADITFQPLRKQISLKLSKNNWNIRRYFYFTCPTFLFINYGSKNRIRKIVWQGKRFKNKTQFIARTTDAKLFEGIENTEYSDSTGPLPRFERDERRSLGTSTISVAGCTWTTSSETSCSYRFELENP